MAKKMIDCYGFEAISAFFHRKKLETYKLRKTDDGTVYMCFHEAAKTPVHRIDVAPDGSTRVMWAYGKWSEAENLQYVPINQDLEIEVADE